MYKARALTRVGSYRARVVFPAAGRWSLSVYDGFVPHCASVHTFKSVVIVPARAAVATRASARPLAGALRRHLQNAYQSFTAIP